MKIKNEISSQKMETKEEGKINIIIRNRFNKREIKKSKSINK